MDGKINDLIKKKHKAPAFRYIFFDSKRFIHDVYTGYRNIEAQIQVNHQTSFHAFSTTKTFTSVAIMQLVENGLITLDEPVSSYLPSFNFSKPLSIRNLLCHQSGLANPIPLKWTHLAQEHDSFDYSAFLETVLLKNLKLKRSPGKKFAYSNLNYLVLGKIIETVSESHFQEYIDINILQRIQGNNFIGFDIPKSNHATGYHANRMFQNILLYLLIDKSKMMYNANKDWNGFHPFYINGAPYGGLLCTPSAMAAYCQELLNGNGSLISKPIVDEMLTEQQSGNGKNTSMALGWFKGNIEGQEYYYHAGGGAGYYSEIRLYPYLGQGSVVMTNSSGMTDERILDYLDVNFLPKNSN